MQVHKSVYLYMYNLLWYCIYNVYIYLMTLFPVLVDVYHKEQLVTKEEAEKVASNVRGLRWKRIAVTKDSVTAARIADILDTYGFNHFAQHIRGKCVYSCLCV